MPRYSLNTRDYDGRPPWWGWVLAVLALGVVGAVGQRCQGSSAPPAVEVPVR